MYRPTVNRNFMFLTLSLLSLLMTLLGGCGVQPVPPEAARQPGQGATTTNPALRLLDAPTSPQATSTRGVSTVEPGSPVRTGPRIVPIENIRPPEAYFTPTPLPPGTVLPPPPAGEMPPFPTRDPRTPDPTRDPSSNGAVLVTPVFGEPTPRLSMLDTPVPENTATVTPTP